MQSPLNNDSCVNIKDHKEKHQVTSPLTQNDYDHKDPSSRSPLLSNVDSSIALLNQKIMITDANAHPTLNDENYSSYEANRYITDK